MHTRNLISLLILGSLIVASCQLGPVQINPLATPLPPRGPTASPVPGPTATFPSMILVPTITGSQNIVATSLPEPTPLERAIKDLASRLGVPEQDITVVLIEDVDWPDPGLGLGKPGVSYIQIIVPGQRIHLSHNGVVYEYRSGGETLKYAGEVSQP